MKWLLFTLLALVATCVAWFAWTEGVAHRRVVVEPVSPTSAVSPSKFATPHGTRAKSGARRVNPQAPDVVSILSREGFTLYTIELALPDGTWRPIELQDGCVSRAELASAASLRAPGHRPHVVDREAREITLDVDALLTIEGDELDACIEPIDIWETLESPHGFTNIALYCAQRLDARHVGLAVTCDDVDSKDGAVRVRVPVDWRSGHAGWITFLARSGAREHLDLPCPAFTPHAPLQVIVESAPNVPLKRPLVTIAEERSWANPAESTATSNTQTFAWGTLAIVPAEAFSESLAVIDEPRQVTFDSVPVGISLLLSAFDRETKAWSSFRFVHDGTARHVVLHPGVVVSGRFARGDVRATWPDLKLTWTQRYDESSEPAWMSSGETLRIARDGSFEATGPSDILAHGEHGDTIPRIVDVTVTSLGSAPWTKRFTMDASGRLDCGVIELVEATSDLRVVLDGTESTPIAMLGREVVLGWEDGTCQVATIELVRASVGAVELCVACTSDPRSSHGKTRTWSKDGVVRFETLQVERAVNFITATDSPMRTVGTRNMMGPPCIRGFTRTSGNTFRAAPLVEYALTIVTESNAPPLFVGMSWQGIPDDQALGTRLSRGVHESTLRVFAPETRMNFWWIREDEGLSRYHVPNLAGGSWKALVPGESRMVIPEIEAAK